MPLRAILNNQDLLAPLLSDGEWEALKREKVKVILPCCNVQGYLRISKLGIKHFVHKTKGDCNSASETWQHLVSKTEIAKACKAKGYEVKTEATGEDWRADVLAIKQFENGKEAKLAFEVQWSPQNLEETEQRQEKYTRDGIRCCWLFRDLPTHKAIKEIPMFQLDFEETDPIVKTNIPKKTFKLFDFITELLSSNFRFCQSYRYKKEQDITIGFFHVNCWGCRQQYYIYHVNYESYQTMCNKSLDITYDKDGKFLPEIIDKAYECLKTQKAKNHNIKMGKIKPRYSRTVNQKYTSFGCPYCNRIFGKNFYFQEFSKAHYNQNFVNFKTRVKSSLKNEEGSHWCYSQSHDFCCNN